MAKHILKRKNKATPETLRIILKAIEDGLTQKDAAILAGVDQDTITLWKKDSDFSDQMRRAEIKHKAKHIGIIETAAKNDPKLSKWVLERKFPEEYGPRLKGEVNISTDQLNSDKILDAVANMLGD